MLLRHTAQRYVRVCLPVSVTAVLLFLVVRKVGLGELAATLSEAHLSWIAISVLVGPLLTVVSALKWQALLGSQGCQIPFVRLFVLYLVGKFFNNFAPSNVGGDLVRGYELRRYTHDVSMAMASVIVERFSGFVVLVTMAIMALLIQSQLLREPGLLLAVGIAGLGLAGMLWLLLDARPLGWLRSIAGRTGLSDLVTKIERLHASVTTFRRSRGVLGVAFLWSLLFMILAILNIFASAKAFDDSASLLGIAAVVPIIFVVAMLPITFNGIGLQEWAYVILFMWIGLPQSVGLSTIILMRGKEFFLSLLGGILYMMMKASRQAALEAADVE